MTSSILEQLKADIRQGHILVKVSITSGKYKITQLTDKRTGETLTPEWIVPELKEPKIKTCLECKKAIILGEVYISQHEKSDPSILVYYHSKCHILKGTTSSTTDWNGNINDNDEQK